MIFAFMVVPEQTEQEAIILTESIRTFAGKFSDSPIYALIPTAYGDLSSAAQTRLALSNVTMLPFQLVEESRGFPFAAKVQAAAEAERQARGKTNNLVWMDVDSIVIQQPDAFVLPKEKQLAYRPVDHTLIGSPFDEPLDDFWTLLYEQCQVKPHHAFAMKTSVDERKIRPYFNAGMLVIRPELSIMQTWRAEFLRLFLADCFQPFYEQHILYRIFMHQAVLTGVMLAQMEASSLEELPYQVNYPLHMHDDYPVAKRLTLINELISCRYDTFFQNESWQEKLPAADPLRQWLIERIRMA